MINLKFKIYLVINPCLNQGLDFRSLFTILRSRKNIHTHQEEANLKYSGQSCCIKGMNCNGEGQVQIKNIQ